MRLARALLILDVGAGVLAPSTASADPCGPVAGTASCGQWFGLDTSGGTTDMDDYPGFSRADGLAEDGAEYVLSFTAPDSYDVDVKSIAPGVDVDLFVLQADCDSDSVVAATADTGYTTETVEGVAVTAGDTYYVVIDSPAAYGGVANVVIHCDWSGYETCNDMADNDGDGLDDCDDPDCALHWDCNHVPELCYGGADEDADGLVDCADPDCAGFPFCGEQNCQDGFDDDGDGATDCCDSDCQTNYSFCQEAFNCGDGVDNDCDGIVDCDDLNACGYHPYCSNPEVCDDGIDNDNDGYADCLDGDCAADPGCGSEVCDDLIDNDCDGIDDWNDPDCVGGDDDDDDTGDDDSGDDDSGDDDTGDDDSGDDDDTADDDTADGDADDDSADDDDDDDDDSQAVGDSYLEDEVSCACLVPGRGAPGALLSLCLLLLTLVLRRSLTGAPGKRGPR